MEGSETILLLSLCGILVALRFMRRPQENKRNSPVRARPKSTYSPDRSTNA